MDIMDSSDQDEDLVSCHICLYEYDYAEHQPKFLDCHHYFCSSCLKAMCVRAVTGILPCPTCRDPTKIRSRRISDFRTNHVAMRLIKMEKDRALERKFFSQILASIKSDTEEESSDTSCKKEDTEDEAGPSRQHQRQMSVQKSVSERAQRIRAGETTHQYRIRLARANHRRRHGSESGRDQRGPLRRW